jgi:hypothetical protein
VVILAILLGSWGCQSTNQTEPIMAAIAVPPVARIGAVDVLNHAEMKIVLKGGTGMVVVNRKPMGLAPLLLSLPVTKQGFLAEMVVVAVRFVAADVTEASITVEEVLEVTDKAPAWIEFSRDGAHRGFDGTH